jgi:hypothetical protein
MYERLGATGLWLQTVYDYMLTHNINVHCFSQCLMPLARYRQEYKKESSILSVLTICATAFRLTITSATSVANKSLLMDSIADCLSFVQLVYLSNFLNMLQI